MRTKLRAALFRVGSSYWFIPGMMAIVAVILAVGSISLDRLLSATGSDTLMGIRVISASGARSILATIAGSMVTVAGVTFSMTLAAVSSAAAQYGPRIVGNFMRDRSNQATLGVFVAAFLYSLIALQAVDSVAEREGFVPSLTVTLALCLSIGAVAMLIFFIHHMAEMLNVGNLTAQIGRSLIKGLEKPFPFEGDQKLEQAQEPVEAAQANFTVVANESGFIQTMDVISIAENPALKVVKFHMRPGDFVLEGECIASVVTADEKPQDTDVNTCVLSCLDIGSDKTEQQNALFAVDQLVEIASRALSPGVNDPYTAMSCIDWLTIASNHYAGRGQPHHLWTTATQQACYVNVPGLTHSQLIDAGLVQIARYARNNEQVLEHLSSQVQRLVNAAGDDMDTPLTDELLTLTNIQSADSGE